MHLEALDLNEMVRETLALVLSDLSVKNVPLKEDLETDLPTVQGDRIEIQQVLLNLLMNARDAVGGLETGWRRITVRTTSSGEQGIQVAVSDSGIGIPEEKMENIIASFWCLR